MNDDFSQQLITLLKSYGHTRMYRRGEFISQMGDEINQLMVICSGRAKVMIHSDEGRTLLLSFSRENEILGDLEYFAPGLSTVTIQAVSDCQLLAMDLSEFRLLVKVQPDLIELLGRSVAFKLRRSNSKSSVNILYPLRERFASYLYGLITAPEFEDVRGDSLTDMADLLGTSYRHLNRVITDLCDEQILARTKYGLKVKHVGKLATLARDIYFY